MHTLKIENLTLEPQVPAHAEEMFLVLSDPAIYEFENEPPSSVEWLFNRFATLEARKSPNGREEWLNWVIRHITFGLVGYVQATVHLDGRAEIAYVLSSKYWGQRFARKSVEIMISELVEHYQVRNLCAVFKHANFRSHRLLERLHFSIVKADLHIELAIEPGEILMHRAVK